MLAISGRARPIVESWQICSEDGCALASAFHCPGISSQLPPNLALQHWICEAPQLLADIFRYVDEELQISQPSAEESGFQRVPLTELGSKNSDRTWQIGWSIADGVGERHHIILMAVQSAPNTFFLHVGGTLVTLGVAPWIDHQRSAPTAESHAALCHTFIRRIADTVECAIQFELSL